MANIQNQNFENLTEISNTLRKILMLLQGNNLDDSDKGLLGEVNKLRTEVDELKRFKDRALYIILGAGITLGWTISDVIAKLFAK